MREVIPMPHKLEYCTWCKADISDLSNRCSKCVGSKIYLKRKLREAEKKNIHAEPQVNE